MAWWRAGADRDERHGRQAVQPLALFVLVDFAKLPVVLAELAREKAHRRYDDPVLMRRLGSISDLRQIVVFFFGPQQAPVDAQQHLVAGRRGSIQTGCELTAVLVVAAGALGGEQEEDERG